MYISFDKLPKNARLWVYQSSTELGDDLVEAISTALNNFISQWKAHGKDLEASFNIQYNRFIILGVDESKHGATGCSIDSSVAFIKQLAQHFNLEVFDRSQIAFIENDELKIMSLNEFKYAVKAGQLSEETKVFNNAITTKGALLNEWLVPLNESWAKRYLPSTAL